MSRRPEVEVPRAEEASDRFSRSLAIAIVVGTLLAAGIEFFEASASSHAAAAARDAQAYAVEAGFSQSVSQDRASVQYEAFALGEEDLTRAGIAYQMQVNQVAGQADLPLAQQRWEALAGIAQSSQRTALGDAAHNSPDSDPQFPNRFFVQQLHEANRNVALGDALNTLREQWSQRGSQLVAVLTLVAVGLYMLGLSLTLKLRIRYALAGLGGILIIFAVVRTGIVIASNPTLPPADAARYYADGMEALNGAASLPDTSGYNTAVTAFNRAIALRPDFARAYFARSQASFAAASPQVTGPLSLTSVGGLVSSTQDLLKANSLGFESATLYTDLGFQEYLLYLKTGSQVDLSASIDNTQRALALRRQAIPLYNLGLAQLASGHASDAAKAYDDAVAATVFKDPSRHVLLGDSYAEEQIVGGALTDLGVLAAHRPDLKNAVAGLKAFIVGAVAEQKAQPAGPARTGKVVDVWDVSANRVRMDATINGYDPATDKASVQWYFHDPAQPADAWAVLPEASGPTTLAKYSDTTNGTFFEVRTSYLAQAHRCLGDGDYRVEVYVNGALAASREQRFTTVGALTPALFHDTGTLMCVPAGGATTWQRLPAPKAVRGLVGGYASSDGTEGAAIFRFDQPVAGSGSSDTSLAHYRQLALDIWRTRLYPSVGALQPGQTDLQVDEFMWLHRPTESRSILYSGGIAWVGSGTDADGSVVVGLVFGPVDYVQNGVAQGSEVWNSMTRMDAYSDPDIPAS